MERRPVTVGALALAALLRIQGATAIAREIGCTPRGVHYLATGARRPNPSTRAALARLLPDLPGDAWEHQASREDVRAEQLREDIERRLRGLDVERLRLVLASLG